MKLFKSKLLSKELLGNCYLYLTFERPLNFDFLSGQFITIVISSNVRRSYSIASPDFLKETFSLLVDISPQGVGSNYLNSLKVNQSIQYIGPLGNMVLPKSLKFSYYNFVSTGSGIAPFLSLIPSLQKKVNSKKIYLLHSFKNDYNYFDSVFPSNINKKIVFTQEPLLNYPKGRVTNYLNYLNTHNSLNYLCGVKNMVFQVRDYLKNQPYSQVLHEVFY